MIVVFFLLLLLFYFFGVFFCVGSSLLCMGFSCGERRLPFAAVRGLLTAVASLVAEHGLLACGLSSCGSWAPEHRLSSCGTQVHLLRGTWDLPGPGLEPGSPALAGGLSTTVPPGKSMIVVFKSFFFFQFHALLFSLSSFCMFKKKKLKDVHL